MQWKGNKRDETRCPFNNDAWNICRVHTSGCIDMQILQGPLQLRVEDVENIYIYIYIYIYI